ncbi:related to CCAAT-binding transcription factor subunit aab-1 [Melanopsichium pennsylvanicum]|uniref:Related to CCAAT-binding transcription factor subunit aab-1 n=2 Tax=Melanopsichium pennsylvanicum TaxID=63383 RepID=A0AAJ4XJ63_9BASI|nr:related to CCAAT-binding transcription factor subunit aab-1 [Melanopsichium pennsylvanicum 4]SNX82941.1 related to CCAAT-binding transcription factor subunit aab-1 [Melanopsichium pennsylvanicum]
MTEKRPRASSNASHDLGSTHQSPAISHEHAPSSNAAPSSSRAASALPASGPLVHACQDLDDFQASFWRYQMDLVEQGGDADGNIVDFKSGLPTQGQLPLARIKKVMKSDDQVKMISAEAPILFARACEIFISDLTCRAFLIAEEHKRRTIQRSDIAGAIGRSDLFDFLIDIVPRHESVPSSRLPGGGAAKREKTGEGKRIRRSNAAGASKSRQQDVASDSVLHVTSAGYSEQASGGAASESFNIPNTGVTGDNNNNMAHWIHDTSTDEYSSQPDLNHGAPYHAHDSHHHAGTPTHSHHSAPHGSHDHAHHHGHSHHAGHHSGHHSHHHSPLEYVASNAGTPISNGAGSAGGGGAAPWSHTAFSGFS